MERSVDGASLVAAVGGGTIVRIEREVVAQPFDEIGVRDEVPRERHEVRGFNDPIELFACHG